MSHEIETTAWTNETPWHGLGTKVPANISVEGMLKAAQLDWEVTKEKLKTVGGNKVDNFFALQRSSDESILDVVGKQYQPVQNHTAFSFFNDFVKAGKATMETAGSLRQGKMVWGLANMKSSFTLPGNDKVKGYLLVASPHEQGKSLRIQLTSVRVVCNNTLTMALSDKAQSVFRMSHRLEFDEAMQQKAKEVLGLAHDEFDSFADRATKLAKKKMKTDDQIRFLAEVFMPDIARATIEEIEEDANKPLSLAIQALTMSPGHDLLSAKGTAWGALNAVTYVTDHLLGNSQDARLNKAWFGKTANLKQKALDIATNI